jgi:hypothetical protein
MHAERKLVRNIAKQGSRTPAHAIGQPSIKEFVEVFNLWLDW